MKPNQITNENVMTTDYSRTERINFIRNTPREIQRGRKFISTGNLFLEKDDMKEFINGFIHGFNVKKLLIFTAASAGLLVLLAFLCGFWIGLVKTDLVSTANGGLLNGAIVMTLLLYGWEIWHIAKGKSRYSMGIKKWLAK